MGKTAAWKNEFRDLFSAIRCLTDDRRTAMRIDDGSVPEPMNIDKQHGPEYNTIAVSSSLETSHDDGWSQILPPILKMSGGLANIPQSTLRENLKPVVTALERIDAELLLHLKSTEQGARVRDGRYCKPIHDMIEPRIPIFDDPDGPSCVRYLHISEVPDQYSIGIFVFAPYARIPLHDHPDMCVLSRVLYGDLQRLSLDLVKDEDIPMPLETSCGMENNKRSSTGWLGGWFKRMDSFRRKLPKGSKQAMKKTHIDHLQAPAVTVLYPYEGNLHEFIAGPNGAAVLDVLLPPYDNVQNRDCTFYEIHEVTTTWPQKPEGKEPCFIVPTGQPESFHCISGCYHDIGEQDDDDW